MSDDLGIILNDLLEAADAPATYAHAAQQAGPALAESIRHSFEHRTSPDGDPWAALKQRSRSKGAMKAEALAAVLGGGADASGYASLEYSTPFYRWFQNDGTSRIPARPFWGLGEEGAEQLVGKVADDVAGSLLGEPR